ncbi:MAG TPA: hypothetical protein P5330_08385 [Candidatus Competibacteraceae bacterium]|nr:hypothetical protein [Candidatus Competibacteraceae bacterium]
MRPPVSRCKSRKTAKKALVLGDLIQRSKSFQAERRKAEQDANRKRAAAAEQGMVGRAAAKAKVEALSLVPPQVEATLNAPTQKRDHATESQRKASTALAQQVGVNRAAIREIRPHLHMS